MSEKTIIRELSQTTRPGDFIITDMYDHEITICELTQRSGITEPIMLEIFSGAISITNEMATRIGEVFNVNPEVYIEQQKEYDKSLEIFLHYFDSLTKDNAKEH